MSATGEGIELGVKTVAGGADDVAAAVAGGADDVAKGIWNYVQKPSLGGLKKVGKFFFGIPKNEAGLIRPGRAAAKLAGLGTVGTLLGRSMFGGGDGGTQAIAGDTIDPALLQQAMSSSQMTPYEKVLMGVANGTISMGGGVPAPRNMSGQYNALGRMANMQGAASIAAMQKLAEQAGGAATGINATGTASADALKRIYGDTAAQIADSSRQAGVAGSSLTPVSGLLAAMPEAIKKEGGTMSDFLKANQLIRANDLANLSQLASMQGTGYAQQIAQQNALYQMADQMRRQDAYDKARMAAANSSADTRFQALVTAAKLASERQGESTPAPLNQDLMALQNEWNGATADKRARWKADGITNVETYVKRRLDEIGANLAK